MSIDPLGDDFTRADLAHLVNSVTFTGYMAVCLVVFMVAILVFRGK